MFLPTMIILDFCLISKIWYNLMLLKTAFLSMFDNLHWILYKHLLKIFLFHQHLNSLFFKALMGLIIFQKLCLCDTIWIVHVLCQMLYLLYHGLFCLIYILWISNLVLEENLFLISELITTLSLKYMWCWFYIMK